MKKSILLVLSLLILANFVYSEENQSWKFLQSKLATDGYKSAEFVEIRGISSDGDCSALYTPDQVSIYEFDDYLLIICPHMEWIIDKDEVEPEEDFYLLGNTFVFKKGKMYD